MKIWIIKHKGKSWWANLALTHTVTIGDNEFWTGMYFLRKKDAVLYLKTALGDMAEYFEVVGCEVPQSKQDNRKV